MEENFVKLGQAHSCEIRNLSWLFLGTGPDHMLLAIGFYSQVARAEQNDVILALGNVVALSVAEAVPAYAHLRITSAR
jgi:hypothetical protein